MEWNRQPGSEPIVDLAETYLFAVMWLGWAFYWWVSARNVKANARRETLASRLSHIVPLLIAGMLIWARRVPVPILEERFLPAADWQFWVGAALTAAGLLFAVWARVHLGRNWSGTVTVKEGHELITSGPYALDRHPIYTGLLLAFVGSALARGEWRGVLAVVIVLWSFLHKLRIEEHWMRETFGEAYQSYSQRVSALAPFIF